ncbi:MAG TPA: RNA polymerase sigma factor [Candidatus Saccharimonadales bacterium]|nr:RNA polymerase sigma factor [Candidatus Saccharimonadales bacterium]
MEVGKAAGSPTFERLVVPQLDYLYALCLRLTGQRAEAEDVLQDALLRAFRNIGQLRDEDRVRYWLTRIVHSAWYDRHRKERNAEQEIDLEDERFSLFDQLVEEDPFPYSDRLHLDFLDLFDDERLSDVLQQIHPPHRTALVLAYIYGYKAREIAELTGSTTGTVLARLHRGRKQLERALWSYATERHLLRGEVQR